MSDSASDDATEIELPGMLGEIEEIAGREAALAIARDRGGTYIYIPAEAGPDHWLVDLVGRQAADSICRYYRIAPARRNDRQGARGVGFHVPVGPRSRAARNRRQVERMIREGKHSAREIALATGYSTRGVERRKQRLRETAE